MKDFGDLKADSTQCSACGSRNHDTYQHQKLNDAAPELLASCRELTNGLAVVLSRCATPATATERAAIREAERIIAAGRAALTKAGVL